MDQVGSYLMVIVETSGIFAPLIFISFHLVRPLLFLPVIFICISGGVLFGAVAGSFYSVIGITLSSIIYYMINKWMPKTFNNLVHVKQKLIGKHSTMTTPQITLLRLIPFIHFQLLSVCLFEISSGFKDYIKSSLLSSIPVAIVYTSMGKWMSQLSPIYTLLFFISILPLMYLFRKKEIYIKWNEFFRVNTSEAN